MFLNSYLKTNNHNKILIDSCYLKIVNVSRNKVFYKHLSVPDTIDGRFDLLVLFSVITIFFLSKFGTKGQVLSQSLFDKIFLDLDLTLRELGAGDAGVHIKIKNMVNSYMGRQKVYCTCLEKNDFTLFKKMLVKNVYRNVNFADDSPEQLTNYCKKIYDCFNKEKESYFLNNKFVFPKFHLVG